MPVHEARAGPSGAPWIRRILIELALLSVVALVLASVGPYGTYAAAPFGERLAYWLRTGAAGYAIYRPLVAALAAGARLLQFREEAGWALATVLGSLLLSYWLWWFGPVVRLTRPLPTAQELVDTFGQVLLLSGLCVVALWLFVQRDRSGPPLGAQPVAPDTRSPGLGAQLAARLPARLGGDVIALRTEDHYVRVYTRIGDALVLMRMSDAIGELVGIPGIQVHRSWWIARDAIVAVERRGRTTRVHLSNGLTAPVARDRLKTVATAGLAQAGRMRADARPRESGGAEVTAPVRADSR